MKEVEFDAGQVTAGRADGGPRTASVIAQTTVTTLSVPAWSFRALLKDQPGLALKMLEEVCGRLRACNASVSA